jgi:hypothetical protein
LGWLLTLPGDIQPSLYNTGDARLLAEIWGQPGGSKNCFEVLKRAALLPDRYSFRIGVGDKFLGTWQGGPLVGSHLVGVRGSIVRAGLTQRALLKRPTQESMKKPLIFSCFFEVIFSCIFRIFAVLTQKTAHETNPLGCLLTTLRNMQPPLCLTLLSQCPQASRLTAFRLGTHGYKPPAFSVGHKAILCRITTGQNLSPTTTYYWYPFTDWAVTGQVTCVLPEAAGRSTNDCTRLQHF